MPLTELLGERDPSVERRLVWRFLEGLPEHRLEDVLFRLMREFGPQDAARRRRIALLGLRGAGKTTLGGALARELVCRFVEQDREIEREAGTSLSEIFLLYGQAGFRRYERRALEKTLEQHERCVIAAGGSVVSEPGTYELLLSTCHTVWLKARPEEHMARVVAQGDTRPMAVNTQAMDDLRRILVCYDVYHYMTKKRETNALVKADREILCSNLIVLTWDYEAREKFNDRDIHYLPLWKWLIA